jgi:hypothetical protein
VVEQHTRIWKGFFIVKEKNMKKVILAAILGLWFSAVQAVDVAGQRYIDQLSGGDITNIKRAAKDIFNTREKDTAVLDVAAEVLYQRYANANASELDTLAWVVRALGNSGNGRYRSLLKEVADSDAHGKLRKHATKALKQLDKSDVGQYVKGTVDLQAMGNSSASKPQLNKYDRYVEQITREGNRGIKQAAQRIYNTGEKDTAILDIAAEVLYQRYGNASNNDLDTLAWVAKALGSSENGRYRSLLKEVVGSDAHGKLRKHAKRALKQLDKSDAAQYAKGTVDLDELKNAPTSQ